jgi:hypothetical protein
VELGSPRWLVTCRAPGFSEARGDVGNGGYGRDACRASREACVLGPGCGIGPAGYLVLGQGTDEGGDGRAGRDSCRVCNGWDAGASKPVKPKAGRVVAQHTTLVGAFGEKAVPKPWDRFLEIFRRDLADRPERSGEGGRGRSSALAGVFQPQAKLRGRSGYLAVAAAMLRSICWEELVASGGQDCLILCSPVRCVRNDSGGLLEVKSMVSVVEMLPDSVLNDGKPDERAEAGAELAVGLADNDVGLGGSIGIL